MLVTRGNFYEFHSELVTSRAGQPIVTTVGAEIGPEIAREWALRQVRNGQDVYTLMKEDAYRLASAVFSGRPQEDSAHDEFYYRHFHPGGQHPTLDHDRPGRRRAVAGPGHVFFGERGDGYQRRR
jgi:hypothetical protein